MKYVYRPKVTRGVSYAAKYEPGQPLDDLRSVARKVDPDAALAEVPDLEVLVVRFLRVPDHHPATTGYEVVGAGDYLVYSETYHLLYDSDPESFAMDHEPIEGTS